MISLQIEALQYESSAEKLERNCFYFGIEPSSHSHNKKEIKNKHNNKYDYWIKLWIGMKMKVKNFHGNF